MQEPRSEADSQFRAETELPQPSQATLFINQSHSEALLRNLGRLDQGESLSAMAAAQEPRFQELQRSQDLPVVVETSGVGVRLTQASMEALLADNELFSTEQKKELATAVMEEAAQMVTMPILRAKKFREANGFTQEPEKMAPMKEGLTQLRTINSDKKQMLIKLSTWLAQQLQREEAALVGDDPSTLAYETRISTRNLQDKLADIGRYLQIIDKNLAAINIELQHLNQVSS